MRISLLILYIIFTSLSIHAQEYGLSLIKNYHPKEFIYYPQVYSAIQDSRGIMYLGITDFGVLEYDGVEWRGIPNYLKSEVYGVVIDKKGTIYVGGANDFGYLFTNKNGRFIYKSIKNQFIDSTVNIGNVWNTHLLDDNVYFFTEKCVYIFNIPSQKLNYLKPENVISFYVPFIFKNKYYLHLDKKGIYLYENSKLTFIPKTDFFADMQFLSALPYDESSVLISTRTSGIYIVDLNGTKPVKKFNLKPSNEFEKDNNLYTALSLDSGRFLIGSMEKGAIIAEHDGRIITIINEKTGLQNNLILASASDFNGNTWLALSLGISRIYPVKDITFWDKNCGLQGNIYDIIRFDKKIYLVTNQKIYNLQPAETKASLANYILSEVKGISPGQNWCLTNYKIPGMAGKEILLAGTQNGIFEIHGNQGRQIYKGKLHAFQITQSEKFPDRIYSTDGFNDFISLVYKNGIWTFEGKWNGINDDIREIVEDKQGNLWLETFTNGLLYVTIDYKNITKPKLVKRYTQANGLPFISGNKPIKYKDSIIFGTEKGLYSFVAKNERFEPYKMFCSEFDNEHLAIRNLSVSSSGNIFLGSKDNREGKIGYLKPDKTGYLWIYKPFRRFPEMASISSFFTDEDGSVWIGSNEGLYKYNPNLDNKNYDLDFKCLIRKVTIGNDSTIYWGNHLDKGLLKSTGISYDFNNLKFNFSAPFFDNEDQTRYSYFLEGYDETWSPWSTSTYKEYTKVNAGSYTFKVKALNIYDKESNVAEYHIQILPPWYREPLAYFIYALAFFLIFAISLRIYSRILVKQKRRLEKTISDRTAEIIKQKDTMQSQAEEMAAQSEELQEKAAILSKINEELEKLSIVASKTDNAVTIMDDKGHFLWVNDGFTRLYGYSINEYLEKYHQVFDGKNTDEISEHIRQCVDSGQTVVFESSVNSKRGKRIFIQTTITPIFGITGKIEKLVAIDSDITRLKEADIEIKRKSQEILLQKEELEQHRSQLEKIVKKRTAELEIAKNKAEESDRLKSAFLANMSHEIRTPMNAIIGFSDLLSNSDTTSEQKEEFARLITYSGNSLLQLIEDIIEIAKIEAGQLKIDKKNCNLNELLSSIYELFMQRIGSLYKKDIQLKFLNSGDDNVLFIETDPFRLQQVITNLLENAVKFTEKGFVEFGFEKVNIENVDIIRFFVKDTGIGLSHDQKNIIFDRFTKIENNKTRLYRGAGLGLAICKNIVTLLGGEIMVQSELNKGSIFSFTIPYQEGKVSFKRPIHSSSFHLNWKAKRILIAEDEDINFRFLEVILKTTEVIIDRAYNGREAVEKFSSSMFDLVLMDIKMPVMDGLEATKLIRRINKEIPIIALTAFAMQNDENLCIEAGCNSYVSKPIHRDMFFSVLKRYLD